MASDYASQVAVSAAVAAAIAAGIMFLYCLGMRAAHIVHARRERRVRKHWWPVFAAIIAGRDARTSDYLAAKPCASKPAILREWSRIRCLVRGKSTTELNKLAECLGLPAVARARLKRKNIGSKLLAIQALGHLGDASSWATIEKLLDHPSVAVSVTAATALVNIDAERAIAQIIPLIAQRLGWPRTQIGRMLNLAGPDVVSRPLCSAIESAPNTEAIQLLQFANSAHTGAISRLVERLLENRCDPALLSAALKAARGHVRTKTVAALTRHDVWYVRMQAASLLGRCGRSEDYKLLEPLLSDKEWWVRYRAAQAVVNLPLLGPNALRKIQNRQKDRFAHDILQQALAEKGLA